MKCQEIFSTFYLGVLCTCKWKIQEVCLRIWCVIRSMILLLIIDQWVCSLSFVTLWNRGKMVDWKSFWFIFSRCCLEEIHNSICCQLYPELIKPVTLSSTCIFIFSKQSIFLISFNDQLFFMLNILLWSVITNCCNMQYPELWNMASSIHLIYLVNLYACQWRVYPLLTREGYTRN